MRRSNIITERTSKGDRQCISYIPRKTKDGNPVTVYVPLNATALEILKKYDYMKNEVLVDNRYSKEKQAQAISVKNGLYPPTQNGDIRSLFLC